MRTRKLLYILSNKDGEKTAKKLLDLGELKNYSTRRLDLDAALTQIIERINILEGELTNAAVLENMPAAEYFLRSRLRGLESYRDKCLARASQSQIDVGLFVIKTK